MDRIGFSSYCFPEATSIEEMLQFCLEHKFNAMELALSHGNSSPEKLKASTSALIKNSGRISFSLHSPEDINFSDPIAEKRENSIGKVEDSITLALKLGIRTVVVHPGRIIGEVTPGKLNVTVEQNVSAIRRCALMAKKLGITVSVENLCHQKGAVTPNISSFLSMCKKIGLSNIGITLDTNHADLVDGIAQTVSIIGEYIDHIHFSSNKGKKSDHCEPDIGVIDFHQIEEFLKKFNGLTIIELKETGDESTGAILRSREYLLTKLSNGERRG